VLGQFVFSAAKGGEDSEHALADPYDSYLTLERHFLDTPLLRGVITDTHFAQRDRMGRLVAFLARIVEDGWAREAYGVAVDEQTAIVVEADGGATVLNQAEGDDHVAYIVHATHDPETCHRDRPLTYRDLTVTRAAHGATLNMTTLRGLSGVTEYNISAVDGEMKGRVYK